MEDKKKSWKTEQELSDEQLEKVGGGSPGDKVYYGECDDCRWRSGVVTNSEALELIANHKKCHRPYPCSA